MAVTWPLKPYNAFVASPPIIPKMYWDVYSQEQRWKEICCTLEKIRQFLNTDVDSTNELYEMITELQQQFDEFKASGFDDYYKAQVQEWIDENLKYVFDQTAKQVFFGLTLDGYFVAYIPKSWDDIIFDTGHVFGQDTYGRLILRWEVEPSAQPTYQEPEPNRYL